MFGEGRLPAPSHKSLHGIMGGLLEDAGRCCPSGFLPFNSLRLCILQNTSITSSLGQLDLYTDEPQKTSVPPPTGAYINPPLKTKPESPETTPDVNLHQSHNPFLQSHQKQLNTNRGCPLALRSASGTPRCAPEDPRRRRRASGATATERATVDRRKLLGSY